MQAPHAITVPGLQQTGNKPSTEKVGLGISPNVAPDILFADRLFGSVTVRDCGYSRTNRWRSHKGRPDYVVTTSKDLGQRDLVW